MSDVSDQRMYYERMMDEIAVEHQKQFDKLTAENAKLRELVGGLMCCPVYQDDCARCKHVRIVPKEETGNWPHHICTLCERAKEMGIEVDG